MCRHCVAARERETVAAERDDVPSGQRTSGAQRESGRGPRLLQERERRPVQPMLRNVPVKRLDPFPDLFQPAQVMMKERARVIAGRPFTPPAPAPA